MDNLPETISLAPTPEGYVNMARFLIDRMCDDFISSRRSDAKFVLRNILEITAYIAANHPELTEKIIEDLPKER